MRIAILSVVTLLSATGAAQAGVISNLVDACKTRRTPGDDIRFRLDCTVIFNIGDDNKRMIVTDGVGSAEIFLHEPNFKYRLRFGDRLRISGPLTADSPAKEMRRLFCDTQELLPTKGIVQPKPITAKELLSRVPDLMPVEIRGTVIDACIEDVLADWALLILDCQGLNVYVTLYRHKDEPFDFSRLLGAEVSVIGTHLVPTGSFRKTIKCIICPDSLDQIRILSSPPADDIFNAEDISRHSFQTVERQNPSVKRSAVGRVLAVWNGNNILLRTDDGKLVKGELAQTVTPAFGTRVRIVGHPETDLYTPILIRALWKYESKDALMDDNAVTVTTDMLRTEKFGLSQFNFAFHGQTIRLSGTVRSMPSENGDGLLYLESDGQMVTIDAHETPGATQGLQTDFRIEVTGTCVMDTEKVTLSRIFPRINGYRIVVRRPTDIRILAFPSWWTPARFLAVIVALLIVLTAILIWNLTLHRFVERKSHELLAEQLARVESDLKVGERTRLSVELHDTLSQNLVGAAMEINTAEQLTSDAAALRHLNLASRTIKASRDELRNCLWDLRSQALEEADMNMAIRRTLEPYVNDINLQIRFNVPRALFTDNTAHALMRIIRELVLNAIRHGHARNVKIAGSREGDQLLFSVRDDGGGFDPTAAPGISEGHFGLQGVRERLRLLKGSVRIDSTPGAGTHVAARFWIPDSKGGKI